LSRGCADADEARNIASPKAGPPTP
jgi:hypothetical protein